MGEQPEGPGDGLGVGAGEGEGEGEGPPPNWGMQRLAVWYNATRACATIAGSNLAQKPKKKKVQVVRGPCHSVWAQKKMKRNNRWYVRLFGTSPVFSFTYVKTVQTSVDGAGARGNVTIVRAGVQAGVNENYHFRPSANSWLEITAIANRFI